MRADFSQYLDYSSDRLSSLLQSAYQTEPPQQLNDLVVFLNKPQHPVRYMGIAFAHEDFSKIHLFSKQKQGVYYFIYKVTGELSQLDYRLVMDGIWRSDDSNELQLQDVFGHELSRFELDTSIMDDLTAPQILKNNEVLFRYRGEAGKRVFFNSDICSWDPFVFKMEEIRPGLYERKIRMTSGTHWYYFLVDGIKLLGNVSLDTRIHKIEGEVNQIILN